MTEPTTPLMQQYHAVKKAASGGVAAISGSEISTNCFYEDASAGIAILQITLTSRNKEKEGAVPMCGVPYHAAENYIARLIRAGHKVAICEQMEEPGPGKKIVRREVIRVLTPGTATGAGLIDAKENNFLAAVARSSAASAAMGAGGRTSSRAGGAAGTRIGLAFVDLSTGEFRATEFAGRKGGSAAARRTRYFAAARDSAAAACVAFSFDRCRLRASEWLGAGGDAAR